MRSTLIPAEFDASGLPLTAYIEHPRAVICNTTPMRISAATMVRGMIGQPSMVTWPNNAQPSESDRYVDGCFAVLAALNRRTAMLDLENRRCKFRPRVLLRSFTAEEMASICKAEPNAIVRRSSYQRVERLYIRPTAVRRGALDHSFGYLGPIDSRAPPDKETVLHKIDVFVESGNGYRFRCGRMEE